MTAQMNRNVLVGKEKLRRKNKWLGNLDSNQD